MLSHLVLSYFLFFFPFLLPFPRSAVEGSGCADGQHDRRVGHQHGPRLGERAGGHVGVQLQPDRAVRESDKEAGGRGGGARKRQTTSAEEEGGGDPPAPGETHKLSFKCAVVLNRGVYHYQTVSVLSGSYGETGVSAR